MSNVDCICGDGSYGWQCSRCYPSRTIAGMYKQEQELAKADDTGLTITSKDLEYPSAICKGCAHRGNDCIDCEGVLDTI